MFERKKIQSLNDYFLDLSARRTSGVYFYRISGYNAEISDFIQKYFQTARVSGVVIEGKIPNPNEKNLAYYSEIMGMEFSMRMDFIISALKKWLPRMNDYQRRNVAASIYNNLDAMRKAGKNENMQKNAYIKFMCWLYYKFERIINHLGENKIPKILYEGKISIYELQMLSVLSNAGCDVLLLQYHGEDSYRKIDSQSFYSDELKLDGMTAFPGDFNLKWMQEAQRKQEEKERLYGPKPAQNRCTNAWIKGRGWKDCLTDPRARGGDLNFFYNCFCRICGADDKLTFPNELYRFYLEMKNGGRRFVIVENEIPKPSMEEINAIRRKNYSRKEEMLMDLSSNIQCGTNTELKRLMHRAFIDVMTEAQLALGGSLNKLTGKAVYLLCWLNRYQPKLFSNWKPQDIACFIYLNGCKDDGEALFLKFMARLPADVLILNPDKKEEYPLKDEFLYEIHCENSLSMREFPAEDTQMCVGTAAYHAERELDTLMYQDSGMYRSQQYAKGNTVSLRTTYEEIEILWDQELKYRPNFDTAEDIVVMPVIFAKVSGVKDADVSRYWSGIKSLITKDTIILKDAPYIRPTDENPMKAYASEFFKNGKLQREKIKTHKRYPYSFLREEMQEHILNKLQLLIQQKIIRGTFENGTEYTAVSTVLNLNKEITRLLQKFDFTKKNPKLIFISAAEAVFSLEDAILAAFLNLAGFDILFFVPTGYRSIEKYFNSKILEEHQIGEYLYDLTIPDFGRISSGARQTWREKIFKRGR